MPRPTPSPRSRSWSAPSATWQRRELEKVKTHGDALETLERTTQHLRDNEVNLEQTRLTLGPHLRLAPDREAFVDNAEADALLTREYRKPFVVPAEKDV